MFLLIILIAHFIVFIAPLIIIGKKGADPHGTHKGYSILARCSSISYFLLIIYLFMYILVIDITHNFYTFSFLVQDILIISGMVLAINGILLESLGIITLGLNFRIELPKEDTRLITSGIYRIMRNPIALSVYLFVIGVFLITPNIISLLICIFNIITFNAKVAKEEKFLLERFGYEYEQYAKRVGRYFPLIFKNTNKK
jgi:protein-S-isoprenylcysteine O-methyltransferase Ste14